MCTPWFILEVAVRHAQPKSSLPECANRVPSESFSEFSSIFWRVSYIVLCVTTLLCAELGYSPTVNPVPTMPQPCWVQNGLFTRGTVAFLTHRQPQLQKSWSLCRNESKLSSSSSAVRRWLTTLLPYRRHDLSASGTQQVLCVDDSGPFICMCRKAFWTLEALIVHCEEQHSGMYRCARLLAHADNDGAPLTDFAARAGDFAHLMEPNEASAAATTEDKPDKIQNSPTIQSSARPLEDTNDDGQYLNTSGDAPDWSVRWASPTTPDNWDPDDINSDDNESEGDFCDGDLGYEADASELDDDKGYGNERDLDRNTQHVDPESNETNGEAIPAMKRLQISAPVAQTVELDPGQLFANWEAQSSERSLGLLSYANPATLDPNANHVAMTSAYANTVSRRELFSTMPVSHAVSFQLDGLDSSETLLTLADVNYTAMATGFPPYLSLNHVGSQYATTNDVGIDSYSGRAMDILSSRCVCGRPHPWVGSFQSE